MELFEDPTRRRAGPFQGLYLRAAIGLLCLVIIVISHLIHGFKIVAVPFVALSLMPIIGYVALVRGIASSWLTGVTLLLTVGWFLPWFAVEADPLGKGALWFYGNWINGIVVAVGVIIDFSFRWRARRVDT